MEDLSSKGIESSIVKERLGSSSTLKIVVTPVNCISKSWTLNISLKSRKQADNWVTTFEASKEADVKSHSIDLDVVHSITEQNETQTIHIEELISDRSVDTQVIPALPDNKESFVDNLESAATYIESGEPQDGSHLSQGVSAVVPAILSYRPAERDGIALSDDLRTLTTLTDMNNWSWATTSRVLRSNERFSFVLDECVRRHPFYIGVTNKLPSDPNRCTIWKMEVSKDFLSLCGNGMSEVNYGRYHRPPQVGYRYSVVRKSNGDLHFEVNGRDLGVAFTNVPEEVYGQAHFCCGMNFTID